MRRVEGDEVLLYSLRVARAHSCLEATRNFTNSSEASDELRIFQTMPLFAGYKAVVDGSCLEKRSEGAGRWGKALEASSSRRSPPTSLKLRSRHIQCRKHPELAHGMLWSIHIVASAVEASRPHPIRDAPPSIESRAVLGHLRLIQPAPHFTALYPHPPLKISPKIA
jgi:hypothetical protein